MAIGSRRFIPFVLGPAAFNLLPAAAELAGLGSYAFELLLFEVFGILCASVGACWAWFTRHRRHLPEFGVLVVTTVLTAYPCLRFSMAARRFAFAALTERSRPLVAAIEAFSRTHGRPPTSLAELVPKEIDRIPSTRMPAYPTYEYSVTPADAAATLHWYDLGSRHGVPFSGLWKYPDGEKDHAILVVTTTRDGTVKDVAVDRMASTVPATPFDAGAWQRDASQRAAMVADLLRGTAVRGRRFADVVVALGPTTGQRTLSNTPWELRVPCSQGGLNWDVFFYWPGQRYPSVAYGGSVERIGAWAYVHE